MLASEYGFAVLGGALIAIATSLNLLMKGRITGMSGIFFGVITMDPKSAYWKVLYIATTFMTGLVVYQIAGFDKVGDDFPNFFDHPAILIKELSKPGYFIAGLLVGLGTKLGNGCTSGHGVCGLPRFSIRSWVYVPIFVAWAFIVATFRHYVPFLNEDDAHLLLGKDYEQITDAALLFTMWALVFYGFYHLVINYEKKRWFDIITTVLTAFIFAMGLIVSGMVKRSKILGFLVLNEDWDVCLLLVLCSAVGINFLTFHYIIRIRGKTVLNEELEIPKNSKIDKKLVLGGFLFGLGWGLGGLCPGPGFVLFPFMTKEISLYWFFGLTAGQYMVKTYEKLMDSREKSKVKA